MASGKRKGSQASSKDQEQHANGAENLADELGGAATEASESVQDAASEVTQNLRQQITSQVTAQQERVVDTLETVSLLLQQAGEHARKEDKTSIAQFTDEASGQVERFSNAVRDREPEQLLSDTKQLAQNRPGLFVGGALLAGFLGARFLRSSTQSQRADNQQETTQNTGASSTDSSTEATTGTGSPPYGGPSAASGVTEGDTAAGTETATGMTDTTALAGTRLEEDAAILEELEREELLREEEEHLGGTGTDDAFGTGNGSETR